MDKRDKSMDKRDTRRDLSGLDEDLGMGSLLERA